MDLSEIITLVVAIVGAATGVLALALQWSQHRLDATRISVKGGMTIYSNEEDPRENYKFWVEITNSGRRVARVAEVFVALPDSRIILFESTGEGPLVLEEGEMRRIEHTIRTNALDVLIESMAEKEKLIAVLTTGQRTELEFFVVKKSVLDRLRSSS